MLWGAVALGAMLCAGGVVGLITLRQSFEICLDVLAWRRGLLSRPRIESAASGAREVGTQVRLSIAVLVPAWAEAEVIGAMLARTARVFSDPDSRIYVGCYPNDAATRAAVQQAMRRHPGVRLVLLAHPGPTSKADCLNHLYRAALAERAWDVFVLHDAEDAVEAAEPAVLRAALLADPDLAFVQLPVRAHREARTAPIAHLYADEFAAAHTRLQPLRAMLTGAALSAGVGTAIRAEALRAVAADDPDGPFAADCLCEDYLLALTLAHKGWSSRFLTPWRTRRDGVPALVAVEECFPSGFTAAVRQRARWMVGIALQAPKKIGWFGGLWQRLFLLLDRLMILCALADLLALLFALACVTALVCGLGAPSTAVTAHTPLLAFAGVNLVLGLWRLGLRVLLTARVYTPAFALGGLLRWPLGILVNAAAALRALRLYWSAAFSRRLIAWDKTSHRFPRPLLVQEGG